MLLLNLDVRFLCFFSVSKEKEEMGSCCTSDASMISRTERNTKPQQTIEEGTNDIKTESNETSTDSSNKQNNLFNQKKNIVIIKHHAKGIQLGKAFCVHEFDDENLLFGDGDNNILSKFEIFVHKLHSSKFKSLHTGNYIRIISQSNNQYKLDCNGFDDDQFTLFKVHHLTNFGQSLYVKLESIEC